ncbi:MAG: helix-turn-helix transcriptional regulator [Oscillospiraceae bacterium]|nr:helix-turn-helix transcriptional regulator [Oscillospiraceae bacterium]
MYFYRRIRDLREDSDLSQEAVAHKLGITRQQYQLYESGKREMPMHLFIKLSKIYGVSLDYLAQQES